MSPKTAIAALGGVAAVVAGIVSLTAQEAAPENSSSRFRTAKAQNGTIERMLRVTGTTSARDYASIAAPRLLGPDAGRALVLIELAKSGSWVKRGELIAQIDGQSLKDHVDEVHSQVILAESDIKKRQAEQAIDWENLQQSIRVAKSTLEKAKLDESSGETRTNVDREILKLAVEEAEAAYKQLQQDNKTKQEAFKAEIRILELTRDRHARHRDRHKRDVEKYTITAPIDGLVVMQTFWRSGEMAQIQVGDQIAPGQPFMKIVNPKSMQVEATVSQVGSDELRIGMPAMIAFDAFPGLKLNGKIYALGAIATGGWRQNYYIRNVPVRLAIEGSDQRIIPDLTVSADIAVVRKENVLRIPSPALSAKDGKLIVWVSEGGKFVEREVATGMMSPQYVEVIKGLTAGDEVALTTPPAEMMLAAKK